MFVTVSYYSVRIKICLTVTTLFIFSTNIALTVRECLDQLFPGHWLRRRGRHEWPSRSPELIPK